jgi:hypothetical protein
MACEIGTDRQTANGALTSPTLEAAGLVVREGSFIRKASEHHVRTPIPCEKAAKNPPIVGPTSTSALAWYLLSLASPRRQHAGLAAPGTGSLVMLTRASNCSGNEREQDWSRVLSMFVRTVRCKEQT